MDTQKSRLNEFITASGFSVREFERMLDVSNGTIRKSSDNLSANVKEKISAKFPQLNLEWVLYGVGDMLIPTQNANNNSAPVYQNNGNGGNNVTQTTGAPCAAIEKLIDEMRSQRETNEKQVSRLLTIIEHLTIKSDPNL